MSLLILTDLHLTANKPAGRIGDFISDVDKKLDEVLQITRDNNIEAILCAGDVFHRPDVPYSTVARFVSFLERLHIKFITISGSHDLFGNNLDALYRTALGLLERLNMVELLYPDIRPATRIGGITVGISGTNTDIELAHGSILPKPEMGEYTLIKDYKTRSKIVVVGHYHNGYDIVKSNNTKFICPGSLVRVSANSVELTRRPRVAIVDDNFDVNWIELKSAKQGKEVLSPPLVTKQIDFSNIMAEWKMDNIENISATSLLKEIASKDSVSKEVLDFALNFLEQQRSL